MSIDNNYTGDSKMEKRMSTLERTVFGGDKPQESLVALVHNTNKLIQDFVENDKRAKKQIIMFLLASIGSTVACIFTVGYKSAEFDNMKTSLVVLERKMAVVERYVNEKDK